MTEARDQDTFYYAGGLMRNPVTRRFLANKFKENFAAVSHASGHLIAAGLPWRSQFEKRYAGNFGLIRWTEVRVLWFASWIALTGRTLAQTSFGGLASDKDYEETAAFFKVTLLSLQRPTATLMRMHTGQGYLQVRHGSQADSRYDQVACGMGQGTSCIDCSDIIAHLFHSGRLQSSRNGWSSAATPSCRHPSLRFTRSDVQSCPVSRSMNEIHRCRLNRTSLSVLLIYRGESAD